jgi:hypothetical protein
MYTIILGSHKSFALCALHRYMIVYLCIIADTNQLLSPLAAGNPALLGKITTQQQTREATKLLFTRECSNSQKQSETVRNSREQSETVENSQKQSETVRNCQRLSETVENSQKQSRTVRNSREQSETVKNSQE